MTPSPEVEVLKTIIAAMTNEIERLRDEAKARYTKEEIQAAMTWAGLGGLARGPVIDRLDAVRAAYDARAKQERP